MANNNFEKRFSQNGERSYLWYRSSIENDKKLSYFRCLRLLLDFQKNPSEGRSRPSSPEYQAIADHVRQALDEVYYGIEEPKQALDDAAAKSAKVLGWL